MPPSKEDFWAVPRMWEGETCFIIGGGPSIKDMDLRPLQGRCVLGVNNAFELGDWVNVTFAGDCGWWTRNLPKLNDYGGLLVSVCAQEGFIKKNRRVKHLKRNLHAGIQWRRNDCLCWNRNSGGTAINLAVLFGAKQIVLIGFDMKTTPGADNGGHNWHSNHDHVPEERIYEKRFLPCFPQIARDLAQMNQERDTNVQIVNATPGSALTLFPMVKLEDVL